MVPQVLIVDDDKKTVELVKLYLVDAGYKVLTAYDGKTALDLARTHNPNLVVLDLMLPRIDGVDICRILRAESTVPIIMLTARTTEQDKLLGLELGADDYITKPFSPREVLARVKAVLRRSSGQKNGNEQPQLMLGNLVIDFTRHEAMIGNSQIHLTPKEFKLLETMAKEPEKAFRREELLALVFGDDYEGLSRTIDVHVMNLRKKLEAVEDLTVRIKTIYGVGYKLVVI